MLRITVNSSGLKRRVSLMQRRAILGARAAVVAVGDAVVDEMVRIAPRDTNRYVAGWVRAMLQAGAGIGGKSRLVPAIVRGRFATHQLGVLEKQIKWVEKQIDWRSKRMERWFDNPPGGKGPRRYTPWARAERRRIYSLFNLLERAKEQFRLADNDGESFILIGKGYGRRLSTVRTQAYGGSGRVRVMAVGNRTGATITLKNREAHAGIVESRMGVLSRVYATVNERAVMERAFEGELKRLT